MAALAYSKEWTVVVTAENTARSYQRNKGFQLDLDHPGTYKRRRQLLPCASSATDEYSVILLTSPTYR